MNQLNWRVPEAVRVLSADAPREQWLAERRKGLGGSDAATLLGVNPYQSVYGLWLDKTGHADEVDETDAMRRGNWLEPHLAEHFADHTSIAVRRAGLMAHKIHGYLRASVDRLTADGGVLEIKTTGAHTPTAAEWRHGIAEAAHLQAQWYLGVTGRSHAWFVAWIDPTPIVRGPVERDDELISELFARAAEFWALVESGTPPEVDLATITDAEIAHRWPDAVVGSARETEYPAHVAALLAERADRKAAAKAAAERADEIDRALRVLAGDAEALTIDGRPVATFKTVTSSRLDTKALRAAEPDLAARFTASTTSRRLHIVKTTPKDSAA